MMLEINNLKVIYSSFKIVYLYVCFWFMCWWPMEQKEMDLSGVHVEEVQNILNAMQKILECPIW